MIIELIPKFIMLLNKGQKIPIQGDGMNFRSFLFASDVAEALDTIFHKGSEGETYNISSRIHLHVNQVAEAILRYFPGWNDTKGLSYWAEHVEDRLYNDSMYWTDASKLKVLGWKQRTIFDEGLIETIKWYLNEDDAFWIKK